MGVGQIEDCTFQMLKLSRSVADTRLIYINIRRAR